MVVETPRALCTVPQQLFLRAQPAPAALAGSCSLCVGELRAVQRVCPHVGAHVRPSGRPSARIHPPPADLGAAAASEGVVLGIVAAPGCARPIGDGAVASIAVDS